MRVAVSSTGEGLEAQVSPIFGRCPYFVLVDTETMVAESLPNGAINASGGAGVQASQMIVRSGVGAVISGNVGPNASQVLAAASIPVYSATGGKVREAVEAFQAGQLQELTGPSVPKDFAKPGMGRGGGMGRRG